MTLIFYFLGDLDFKAKSNRVRLDATQRTTNPKINVSSANVSTETSLLQKNLKESQPDTSQLPVKEPPEFEKLSKEVTASMQTVQNFNWAWQYRAHNAEAW